MIYWCWGFLDNPETVPYIGYCLLVVQSLHSIKVVDSTTGLTGVNFSLGLWLLQWELRRGDEDTSEEAP